MLKNKINKSWQCTIREQSDDNVNWEIEKIDAKEESEIGRGELKEM